MKTQAFSYRFYPLRESKRFLRFDFAEFCAERKTPNMVVKRV
jgi:hypothetical protein